MYQGTRTLTVENVFPFLSRCGLSPGQFFLTQRSRDKKSGTGVRFLPAQGGGAGFVLPRKGVEGRLLRQRRPGVWQVAFPRSVPGEPDSLEIPVGADGLYLLQVCVCVCVCAWVGVGVGVCACVCVCVFVCGDGSRRVSAAGCVRVQQRVAYGDGGSEW